MQYGWQVGAVGHCATPQLTAEITPQDWRFRQPCPACDVAIGSYSEKIFLDCGQSLIHDGARAGGSDDYFSHQRPSEGPRTELGLWHSHVPYE